MIIKALIYSSALTIAVCAMVVSIVNMMMLRAEVKKADEKLKEMKED